MPSAPRPASVGSSASSSRPVAVPDEVEVASGQPLDGVEYPHILRGVDHVWWRSVLGVVFGLVLFYLMVSVISQAVVTISWGLVARDVDYRAYFAGAQRFERPAGLLGTNLGIAAAIPIAFVLMAVIHRIRPRWLMSVQPRIRWRYLAVCGGVAVVTFGAILAVTALISEPFAFKPQAGFVSFLLVIVLTSPLQALAEEVLFRGYLLQAFGSLFRQPWFGIIGSSLIFALVHGTQNLPLFVDRLAFGLLAAWLVWKTGGLEAGIAAHVANNLFAFILAGLTTSVAAVRAIQEITWLKAVVDVGGFAVFAALAYLVARRLQLRTRVDLSLGQ